MTKLILQSMWYLRQCLKLLGLWGVLASCLIVITSVYLYINLLSMQALQAQVNAFELNQSSVATRQSFEDNQENSDENKSNDLTDIIGILPREQSLPSLLGKIHQYAKSANLNIISADYKWRKLKKTIAFKDGNLVQYEISFPMTGSYVAIRNMINEVMQHTATLALDHLEFRRESASQNLVEARVTFVIYMIGEVE